MMKWVIDFCLFFSTNQDRRKRMSITFGVMKFIFDSYWRDRNGNVLQRKRIHIAQPAAVSTFIPIQFSRLVAKRHRQPWCCLLLHGCACMHTMPDVCWLLEIGCDANDNVSGCRLPIHHHSSHEKFVLNFFSKIDRILNIFIKNLLIVRKALITVWKYFQLELYKWIWQRRRQTFCMHCWKG